MVVDEGSIDIFDNKKEEESRRIKRERSEEEEEDAYVMRSDLPPGHRECYKLKEQTICLANRTNRNDCFLRQLIMDKLNRWIIPQAEEEAEESYSDMDPDSALEVILDETLPKIH